MMTQLPKILKIKSGENIYEKVSQFLEELYAEKKIGVVSGKGPTYEIALNLCKKIKNYKLDGPFPVQAPTSEEGSRIAQLIQRNNYKHIISVGSGSTEDTCKYAAQLASKDERVNLIHFATAVSHDGIISSRCSIKDGHYISLDVRPPIGLIVPYEIIEKSPYSLATSAMGDVLAKYTAVKDWKSEEPKNYKPEIASLFLDSAKSITKLIDEMRKKEVPPGPTTDFYKEKLLPTVVDACIKCGEGIIKNNSTLGASGSEHDLSHAVDKLTPNPGKHGHQVALWGAFVMYLWENLLNEKMDEITWTKYLSDLGYVEIPVTALQLGVEPTIMVKAPEEAIRIRKERGRYKGALELALANGYSLDTVFTTKILSEMKIVPG